MCARFNSLGCASELPDKRCSGFVSSTLGSLSRALGWFSSFLDLQNVASLDSMTSGSFVQSFSVLVSQTPLASSIEPPVQDQVCQFSIFLSANNSGIG